MNRAIEQILEAQFLLTQDDIFEEMIKEIKHLRLIKKAAKELLIDYAFPTNGNWGFNNRGQPLESLVEQRLNKTKKLIDLIKEDKP